MTVVDLFEYTPLFYDIGGEKPVREDNKLILPEDYRERLDNLNEELKFLEIGLKRIKPLNKVGVVSIGDLTLQIYPKIIKGDYQDLEENKQLIMGNLLKMLSIAGELPVTEAGISNLELERFDFLELLMVIYAKGLLKILKSHRYHQYRRQHDELKYVRGQIDFPKYTSRPARKHIIPCNYNDRTMDNTLNRTLKYAAYLMSRFKISNETYRLLKAVINMLEPVSLTSVSVSEIERITFNRLNIAFKPFVELAKIFLQNSTIKLQHSKVETFTFLIPMESLFERFVTSLITNNRGILPESLRSSKIIAQHKIGHLLSDGKKGEFLLIPDLTIEKDKKRYVIDFKYKILNEKERKLGVSQSDLYQMYAYATKWNADAVLLIYPSISEGVERDWYFKLEDRDIPLYIRTLDLSKDFLDERRWHEFVESLGKHLAVFSG